MKIPSEAELIEIERRARYYLDDSLTSVDMMACDVLTLVALIREWPSGYDDSDVNLEELRQWRAGEIQFTVNLEEHPPT